MLVRGYQHDVVQPPAGPVQIVSVLQDMSVHEEGLARARRALKGEGAQTPRFVGRNGRVQPLSDDRPVQLGAQPLGVIEVAAQVVLREQQGEILVGLPGSPLLLRHAQPAAVRGEVGVVFGKPVGGDPGSVGKRGVRRMRC